MTNTDSGNHGKLALRGKPFAKGNPGRLPGTRTRATMLAEKLLSKDIKKVIQVVRDAATGGDLDACGLVLRYLIPVPKGRRINFPMPPIRSAEDIVAAFDGLWRAVSNGAMTVDEATALSALLERHAEILRNAQLAKRLTAVEEADAVN